MHNCCNRDPKEFAKNEELFEKSLNEVESFVRSVEQKLHELIDQTKREAQKQLSDFKKMYELDPNAQMCSHELAALSESVINSALKAFCFIRLMDQYHEQNSKAEKRMLEVLNQVNKMLGYPADMTEMIKKMGKKDKKFFGLF